MDGSSKSKKRKHGEASNQANSSKRRISHDACTRQNYGPMRIRILEYQILESRKNYNDIALLIMIFEDEIEKEEEGSAAAVSLCRIFARFLVGGNMVKSKDAPDNEVVIVDWLRERYKDYQRLLLEWIEDGSSENQLAALTLLMRLVKDEGTAKGDRDEYYFPHDLYAKIIRALVSPGTGDAVRAEFVQKFADSYDDLRYNAFAILAAILSEGLSEVSTTTLTASALSILSEMQTIPSSQDDLQKFYIKKPANKKHPVRTLGAHKSRAQEAWLGLLKLDLDDRQRKTVLRLMTHRVAPWFANVELLMDFLTDSYNVGGSTSLLALSGLFYLMQEKNLDYPLFYHKLYSLLDADILHSRHRSRFFRLLDTFLSSSHLPAALVASFIKRLSRLALHAPPAAIVIVVPWIYNLLKQHPACTFMIHWEVDKKTMLELQKEGMNDPFDNDEPDPTQTDALESSLWEIQMLQSHYHPNVATLANIISEQFTKQAYNMEDFLDHSYDSMITSELAKEIKKPPVVEYQIPKRIFTKSENEDDGPEKGNLLQRLWRFD